MNVQIFTQNYEPPIILHMKIYTRDAWWTAINSRDKHFNFHLKKYYLHLIDIHLSLRCAMEMFFAHENIETLAVTAEKTFNIHRFSFSLVLRSSFLFCRSTIIRSTHKSNCLIVFLSVFFFCLLFEPSI